MPAILHNPVTHTPDPKAPQPAAGAPALKLIQQGATCVMDYRLSPFCWARLEAAAQHGPIMGLEMSSQTRVHRWEKVEAPGSFTRLTLFPEGEADDAPVPEMLSQLHQALDRHRPTTVAIVGWSFKWSLGALAWCLKNRVPAILLSDSTAISNERRWYRESIKRRLVRLFSTAVVAGSPQRDYVASLGMSPNRIFRGWDVVDNRHFAAGSDAARSDAADQRRRLGLPENYFVSVSRFVELKNLERMLEAYAAYRAKAGTAAWKLVLIGDGPLRLRLSALQRKLGISDDVLMPGWKSYRELPAYYGLAGAFVLASLQETWGLVVNEAMASSLPVLVSNRCGCVHDLVQTGRNGFIFEPLNIPEITSQMLDVASESSAEQRQMMGDASREIIADWSPETWADNLHRATELALSSPRPKAGAIEKLLLRFLTRG